MRFLTQISSIIVAFVFVYSLSFKSLITIDYFIHQTEIIELFCINKENPKLQCDGKCHLAKELVKSDTKDDETPFSQNNHELNLELIFEIEKTNGSTLKPRETKNRWFLAPETVLTRNITIPTPPPKG